MGGYINISRDILNDPIVSKDAVTLGVVVWLMKEAAYSEHEVLFGNKVITLQPGQVVTGRRAMSEQLLVSENKLERTLKVLESRQLIRQQTNSRGRLITLLFWNSDEKVRQQNEQQIDNSQTANRQQIDRQLDTTEINITKGTKETKRIKEKGVSNDTPKKKTQTSVVEESDLPTETKAKLLEWLKYKTERRQGYKETGLNALIRQVSRFVDDIGIDAVNDRIDQAMSNGWTGMNLDKIQGARSSPTRAAPEPEFDQAAYDHLNKVLDEMEASGNASW